LLEDLSSSTDAALGEEAAVARLSVKELLLDLFIKKLSDCVECVIIFGDDGGDEDGDED